MAPRESTGAGRRETGVLLRSRSPILFVDAVLAAALAMGGLLAQHFALLEPWLALPASGAAALIALGAAIPRRVEVGADGLRTVWLGWGRRSRFGDIRKAEPAGPHDVVVSFHDGRVLHVSPHPNATPEATARVLLERLWTSVASGAEEGLKAHEHAALARDGRDLGSWFGALRDLIGAGAQYRQGLVPPGRLWTIATNPAVLPAIRAAAAVAYAPALDDDARHRLRIVADATLDPGLREVLDEIVDGRSDADLADALARIEA